MGIKEDYRGNGGNGGNGGNFYGNKNKSKNKNDKQGEEEYLEEEY